MSRATFLRLAGATAAGLLLGGGALVAAAPVAALWGLLGWRLGQTQSEREE